MVPVGGLEPPRPKATDFESVMSTNSITLASIVVLNESYAHQVQLLYSGFFLAQGLIVFLLLSALFLDKNQKAYGFKPQKKEQVVKPFCSLYFA